MRSYQGASAAAAAILAPVERRLSVMVATKMSFRILRPTDAAIMPVDIIPMSWVRSSVGSLVSSRSCLSRNLDSASPESSSSSSSVSESAE